MAQPVTLNTLRILTLAYSRAKSSNTKANFIIKCQLPHVIYCRLYWEWRTEGLSGCRMVSYRGPCWFSSSWPGGWRGAVLTATAQHHERDLTAYHHPGKDKNSKYSFYWMCISSSPSKSNHAKSSSLLSQEPSVILGLFVFLVFWGGWGD